MQAIVEVINGKTLFDSQKESIGVLSRHVLPSAGKLLVIGMRPKNLIASLFMYDIATGQQVWANDELFKTETAGKGLLGKLQKIGDELSSLQALTSEPYDWTKMLLLTHPNYVIELITNGEVTWKNKIEPSKHAQIHFSPYRKGIVYVGTDIESSTGSGFTTTNGSESGPQKFYYNLYYAYDANTGASVWKQPARENDLLNQIIPHEKGLIICPRSSQKPTINLVNYETGETTWGKKGKGIKAEGSVVSYIETKQGILITTAFDNAWNNKAEEYFLNILDPGTGTLKYPKSVKLKGDLVKSELTPKGLLFTTTKEVNILDTNTGTLLWANSIEAGNPFNNDIPRPFPTGDNGTGKMFVYSPKERALFEVDNKLQRPDKLLQQNLSLEAGGSGSIDIFVDGVIMMSEQNIMNLARMAPLNITNTMQHRVKPALMRALLLLKPFVRHISVAWQVFIPLRCQASSSLAILRESYRTRIFKRLGNLATRICYSANAMKQFNARYKRHYHAKFYDHDDQQEEERESAGPDNKVNGEIMNAIDIKNDKEPEYEVDQIYNYVYYRTGPSELVCYKLK